jgi:hypothetical protein
MEREGEEESGELLLELSHGYVKIIIIYIILYALIGSREGTLPLIL